MAMKKMTDAEKAKLKKNIKQVNLDKPAKKASTKYSPTPMSAAAKKKAALRGKITGLSAKFPAEFKLQKINPSLPKAKKK